MEEFAAGTSPRPLRNPRGYHATRVDPTGRLKLPARFVEYIRAQPDQILFATVVKDLAKIMKDIFMKHPKHLNDDTYSEIIEVPSDNFYGKGYQDIYTRKPSIEQARKLLGWEPTIGLEESLKRTIYSFLEENE